MRRRDPVEALLTAAEKATLAAKACVAWERGGDPVAAADSAAEAYDAAQVARGNIQSDDAVARNSQLANAGWLLLLAGIDEDGRSEDLRLAARLFKAAATA